MDFYLLPNLGIEGEGAGEAMVGAECIMIPCSSEILNDIKLL
jgi:hypothetical protein